MGDDEVATVRTLSEYREVIRAIVVARHGRIVDSPGDNILAEFGSTLDAVEAALAVQAELATRNATLPEQRRMHFRIGVNLGDLVVEGERIYGDGVNVAARVESLADAGGICVSSKVYDEVQRKVGHAFEDLGEHSLKNIAAPVRVFRLATGARQAPTAAAEKFAQPRKSGLSLVVLPFTNMSGTPEQDYFADGLTEDILTELSRFKELFVISRNTSFKYKGQVVDVRKVAKDLNVQYVVEGSVRRAGNRVRVTVQLIDGESDHHIWAERYDRDLQDVFAIQDEVTRAMAAVLPGRMEAAARGRAERKPTANMAAYELVLEAKLLHHRSNRDDNARATGLIERAIELDPKYAHAHAWRACILGQQWVYRWGEDPDALRGTIERELEIAIRLDENDSDVQRVFAALRLTQRNHDKAMFHQQRALDLNPNDDLIVVQQGELLTWTGDGEAGIPWIQQAMRLNPFHPPRFWNHLGRAHFVARRYAEAAAAFGKISAPDQYHHAFLAACHAQLGDAAAAQAHTREVLGRDPSFSWSATLLPVLYYKNESDIAHHREAVARAGLPL